MDTKAQLLAEVEAFIQARQLSDTAFGLHAVNDGKFVRRLRGGANMTLATIDRVRAFIHTHADAHAPPRTDAAA